LSRSTSSRPPPSCRMLSTSEAKSAFYFFNRLASSVYSFSSCSWSCIASFISFNVLSNASIYTDRSLSWPFWLSICCWYRRYSSSFLLSSSFNCL
jgi:hypothetical protein